MERLLYFICAFLILSSSVFADDKNEKFVDEYVKKKQLAPMWFGPRLGRKKRNQHSDDLEILLASDCDEIEEYIRSIPWSLIGKCVINEDKRDKPKSRQFSPRLGRESGEEMFQSIGGRWSQNPSFTEEILAVRSPPFAPRLGRRVLPFTPRLGRDSLIGYY